MSVDNYITMLNNVYAYGTNNHPEHNSNPDYWGILLENVIKNTKKYKNKHALDFGCGQGRNVSNLLKLAEWKTVDGIDISESNINMCKKTHDPNMSNFYHNNGKDFSALSTNFYDFVMSTIVLQHICVYDLRYELLKEIFRVMKIGGVFSFQMGYGDKTFVKDAQISGYYDNNHTAPHSNGSYDVRVSNEQELIQDLTKIGFKKITCVVKPSWADGGHSYWIYTEAVK
jgi:ubiquinone/menaquinone biosynthesis C-methylase UbiE